MVSAKSKQETLHMPNNHRFQQAKESTDKATFEFIVAELELAITFALVAKTTHSNNAAIRNFEHARTAYNSATRFLGKTTLDSEASNYINTKMARLKVLLGELGRQQTELQRS
jgi:hypothetical protein